jgi:two-component system response regulator NreC
MPIKDTNTVMIADDHALVRSGIRSLLERGGDFRVVGEAKDGPEAVDLAMRNRPNLAILDIGMPGLTGIDVAMHLRDRLPQTRVIILSMHTDESYVLRALNAGAKGYVLKASPEEDILAAARAVCAGNAYFSPSITRLLVDDYVMELRKRGGEDAYDSLTLREKQILQTLASGKGNKDIADELNLSVTTVETHRRNIFAKLRLHNLPELILYCVRKGLIH